MGGLEKDGDLVGIDGMSCLSRQIGAIILKPYRGQPIHSFAGDTVKDMTLHVVNFLND
jgi:hypothetical protein